MSERSNKPDTLSIILSIGLMIAGIAVVIVWTFPIIVTLMSNIGGHQFIYFDLGMSLFITLFLLVSGFGLYRIASTDRSRLAVARRQGFRRKPLVSGDDFGMTGDKRIRDSRVDSES